MFTNPAYDQEDREMLHALMESRSVHLSEHAQGVAVFAGSVLREANIDDLEMRNQFVREQFQSVCPHASYQTLSAFSVIVERSQKGLVSEEDTAYQKFFKATLKKFGASSPADFKTDAKKKEFFDYIDKNWKGKSEKSEEKDCDSDKDMTEKKKLGESDKPVGFVVKYSGKTMEIPFSKHPNISMHAAKEMAIKQWKVPKSKQGLVAIAPGYDESLSESEDIEMWKKAVQKMATRQKETWVLVRYKNGGKLGAHPEKEFKEKSQDKDYKANNWNPAGAKVIEKFKP